MLERVAFRQELCRACHRCEAACIAAHHGMDIKEATKRRSEFVARVTVFRGEDYRTAVRCHECAGAPCCGICPTGAMTQLESGRVVLNEALCIGCEMCADACPYGAIRMDDRALPPARILDVREGGEPAAPARVPARCDLCREQRAASGKTFTPCMEACPAQAVGIVTAAGETIFPEKPARKAKA